MISTRLSELIPGPGTNKWGPDTRQTTPSIMVIPGINNLASWPTQPPLIELSTHKTSVKCGHINSDTDLTIGVGMLIAIWCYIGMLIASLGMMIAHWWHVAVLTRPQTLSLIIFQIAPCAGDGNSLR